MTVNTNNTDKLPISTWKFWTQRRYILVIMIFLGFFNIYSLRASMSIAIVAMTQTRYSTLENGTETSIGPEFTWDNIIQGYVLSSYFYGSLFTLLVGGVLARKFGGNRIFGSGVATTALTTLISPWLAELSVFALLGARIFMGLFEGATYASLYTIWTLWIPPPERSRATSQVNCGCYIGTIFSMMFLAYLAEVAGWRSIFWFSGSLGLLWYAAWVYIIPECPEKDAKISKAELEYIQLSLEELKTTKEHVIKWKSVFTSKAVWAFTVACFCEAWGFFTLLTLLPKYFKDVYQFDISKTGMLSAVPYVTITVMTQIAAQLADRIIIKKLLTISQARKCFTAMGFLAQTGFMMGAAYCQSAAGTVFCLAMAVGFGAFAIVALSVNPLDIAPLHSSIVIGLAAMCATVPGIVSPIIAGYIISTENPTVEQWRIVFYITAALYLFGAVYYTTCGSGVRQSWDMETEKKHAQLDNAAPPKECVSDSNNCIQ